MKKKMLSLVLAGAMTAAVLTGCGSSASTTSDAATDTAAETIEEAAEYSNIGINKLECLLRSPRCPFVLYVGKKKLVKRKEFEKFISDNIEI